MQFLPAAEKWRVIIGVLTLLYKVIFYDWDTITMCVLR